MPKGKYIPFTKKQERKIRDDYLKLPVKRLADEMNCSFGRIMRFLKNNNLEIPRDIIEKRVLDSRKKKGEIPFNKGKKQVDYMSLSAIEKSKKTRFKKGNKPHNTNSIGNGAVVGRKDKTGNIYMYIRLKLSLWVLYHRYVWEEVHGKIPDKHVLVFKDGDSTNCNIENLELITMAENMYRNSKYNYPKEIIPSQVLTNQLENKLKKIQNG